jgi:restriction system protein
LEVVSLDDMSWFEFQQFVAHLFEKLGYGKCKKILKGNDSGRDIILSSTAGLTVIECKHYSRGSIGRPVVQKLHSAVISARAKQGFLVTTGRFSAKATEYAGQVQPSIRLVDLRILID